MVKINKSEFNNKDSLAFLNAMVLSFKIGSKKLSDEEVEKMIAESNEYIILSELQEVDFQSLKEETRKKVKGKIIDDYRWLAERFHGSLSEEKTPKEEDEIMGFFEGIKIGGKGWNHLRWIDGRIEEGKRTKMEGQLFKDLDYIDRVYIDTLRAIIDESSSGGIITTPSGREILKKEESYLIDEKLEGQRLEVKQILKNQILQAQVEVAPKK